MDMPPAVEAAAATAHRALLLLRRGLLLRDPAGVVGRLADAGADGEGERPRGGRRSGRVARTQSFTAALPPTPPLTAPPQAF